MPEPTRAVFGNIAPWMEALFYVLMAGSLLLSGLYLASRYRLWRQGCAGAR